MKSSSILISTAKATSYNMILQLMMRLMTFVLNAIIIRFISRDLLGVVNVRLTLLYSTILFLTKEAFDRACISRTVDRDWRHVINLMWCTFPLAVLWSLLLSLTWLYILETPDPASIPHYNFGIAAFAVSTCLEVLAEPLFVTGQTFMFVKLKVLLLGISQATKCVMTAVLVLSFPKWGLVSFAVAQIASSFIYTLLYYVYFSCYITKHAKKDDEVNKGFPLQNIRDFFPQVIPEKPFIDPSLASLTWSFFKQSFLKQILTEGERYVMTFFDVLSFADQGIYDVINNLGSMVARFIFLPIEENGYLFFTQMLTRGKLAQHQEEDTIFLSSNVLGVLLKIVTLIGCIILVFGYSNSFLALLIYGGENLSAGSGPTLLRWYCLYVLVIAINGITEGFVFAAMSKEDVDRYNKKMLVFSVLFLTMAWYLTKQIGSVGFILANCLNMTGRIIHSILFIRQYFAGSKYNPLADIIPSVPVIISLVISLLITSTSEVYFCFTEGFIRKALHIAVSGVCLVTVAGIAFATEKRTIQIIKEHIVQRTVEKDR